MPVQKVCLLFILMIFAMLSVSQSILAQSTAFSYQGRLSDSGNPANGTYDLQFKLFDTATVGTGTQLGSTVTVSNVTVSNGSFSVSLDFGAIAFPGADRYLEIAVRPANTGSYTTLTPRQPITSTPYAIKSQNAATAEGLSAAASATFIQNGTSQQTATNFNIGGNGTAGGTLTGNTVNAVTQYNLNGLRVFTVNGPYNDPFTVLSASNIFVGEDAGVNTTPDPSPTSILGKLNSFFGNGAGQANTTGNLNAFFSTLAGNSNTTGERNSSFGIVAGRDNTTGSRNSFFGNAAGASNTTGSDNAFFGTQAGVNNTGGGASNAFFGSAAGFSNTTGSQNAFFGGGAGFNSATGAGNTFIGLGADFNASNSTGLSNTLLGYRTRVNSGLNNATAIGAQATVTQSNSLVLGGITGNNNGTSVNVGIGTTAPAAALDVVGGAQPMRWARAGAGKTWAWEVDASGTYIRNATDVTLPLAILNGGSVGIGTISPSVRLDVFNDASSVAMRARSTAGSSSLFLDRASAVPTNSAQIQFYSAGTPDFVIGTSEGSAAPSDLSIYNYGTNSNVLTIRKSNGNVGIGDTDPTYKLTVDGGSNTAVFGISSSGVGVQAISTSSYGVYAQSTNSFAGYFAGNVFVSGNVGISTTAPAFKLHVNGETRTDTLSIGTYVSSVGGPTLCANTSTNRVGLCNSSLRYKTGVRTFRTGLDIITRLRPISFFWKESGMPDLGLAAEEVEKVEPLLTFRGNNGQIEGVKYNQLSAVFINAFKEQQAQITQQQTEIAALRQELRQVKQQKEVIRQQQQEMAVIKRLLCKSHPKANICKAKSLK